MGVLENQCLVLNRSWQAVNVITVQAALSMMAADAATGMNFTEGSFVPVKWSDWLNLPVRPEDDCIGTPSRSVRAPRVIIAVKFNKVPLKRPRLTMRHLRERDGGRCAYTERVLKPEECSARYMIFNNYREIVPSGIWQIFSPRGPRTSCRCAGVVVSLAVDQTLTRKIRKHPVLFTRPCARSSTNPERS
jgi:hypothetical protein